MALVAVDTGFSAQTLDFGIGYRQAHTTTDVPGGNSTLSFPAITFGSSTIQIPSHVFSYGGGVRLGWPTGNIEGILGDGLTHDANGVLTGGVVTDLADLTAGNLSYGIIGMSVSAADFAAAASTVGTADDAALLAGMLSGNDLIALHGGGNRIDGGGGSDVIVALGGGNSMAGGFGNDAILGHAGKDVISGGYGNDILLGGAGSDRIDGGGGADLIWAGAGNDTVTGGFGADQFLFAKGDGGAVITDFQAGLDHLVFMGSLAARGAVAITQVGADTHVTFDGMTVTLQNFDHLSFHVTVGVGGGAILHTAVTDFFTGWDYIA